MNLKSLLRGCGFGLLAATTLITGCYPGSPTAPEDRDLISTFFDSGFAFGSQRTYAMPNEVFVLPGSDENISDEFDQQILDDIARNLAALGWIREGDPESNGANVAVVAYKTQQTRTYIFIPWWPGWGFPGWPGWGPGWGIGYPWPSVRQYTAGTIFVDMYDAGTLRNDNRVPAVWSGAADGPLSGSNPDLGSDRVRRDIGFVGEDV